MNTLTFEIAPKLYLLREPPEEPPENEQVLLDHTPMELLVQSPETGLWDEEDIFTHNHPILQRWLNEYIESRISWQEMLLMAFKDTEIPVTDPIILWWQNQYIKKHITIEEMLIEVVRYSTGS